jgi:phosphoribosylaminoimidazole carboxylase (NCAIR synthetase)
LTVLSSTERRWALVVGGGHAEIPLINAAKRAGFCVATTGNRPHERGHPYGDRYAAADFSDADAVTRVAETLGVSAIISGCNDFAALSTAIAAERLGLGGHDPHDVALRIHHKDRFRELLGELQLPTPASTTVESPEQARNWAATTGFPLIVKPVDLTGGKGISVCTSLTEIESAVTAALAISRQPYVVVEQFLSGTRHGFTCFVEAGTVGFWFADDEQYYLNPYLVSGTTTPSSLPSTAIAELIAQIELITRKLALVDGLMHVQCIQTADGPRIIELCRRCPGDLYPRFVSISTGFDYAAAVVGYEADLGSDAPPPSAARVPVTRHVMMANRSGVLRTIEKDKVVTDHLVDALEWWTPGDDVAQPLVDKFGILFMRWRNASQMASVTPKLTELVAVHVD